MNSYFQDQDILCTLYPEAQQPFQYANECMEYKISLGRSPCCINVREDPPSRVRRLRTWRTLAALCFPRGFHDHYGLISFQNVMLVMFLHWYPVLELISIISILHNTVRSIQHKGCVEWVGAIGGPEIPEDMCGYHSCQDIYTYRS